MFNSSGSLGRLLMVGGLLLFLIGVIFQWGDKIGLGRLPGDILIRRSNFTLYLPLGTCLLLSIILSLVLALLSRR